MVNYTVTANGTDIAPYIERDSYSTSRVPVYTETITTMDGIDHVAAKRYKNELTFTFNPMDADTMQSVFAALTSTPITVVFHSLQTNDDETANMVLDSVTARYLSRCLYRGQKWNEATEIYLREL